MNIIKEKGHMGHKMNESNYTKLLFLAEEKYKNINIESHDWQHILRVLNYCKKINKKENVNNKILFPACILHDLGRENGKESIHSESITVAKNLLIRANYDQDLITKILACIKSHSVDSKNKPVSLEAKILFDADKLDSYGAIGVSRFFMMANEQNWSLQKSADKAFERITKLNEINGFYTKEAESIGLSKAKKTFVYYYSLFKELGDTKKVKFLESILTNKYGKLKGKLFLAILKTLY